MEKLLHISEEFLQMSLDEIDYQQICDMALDISGAKYAGFDIYNEKGDKSRTVAYSGIMKNIKKIFKMVGFDFKEIEWEDPFRFETTKEGSITVYPFMNLYEILDRVAPIPIFKTVEKLFGMGEVAFAKIKRHGVMLGYFSLFMPKGKRFENFEIVEIFSRLVGTLIIRKRTDDILKKTQTSLIEAQRIAKMGQWELFHNNNYLHWSDTVCEIFEIDGNKFGATYEAFLNLIHPDDREKVNNAYIHSLKTKNAYEIEHRLLLKNKRIKWVLERCETEFDRKGNPVKSHGIVQDITDRKQLEIKIRENQEFLNNVFESIQDGISVLDTNLRIVKTNPVIKKWYKESLPLEGKKCYEAYHNNNIICQGCSTVRCLKSGKPERSIVPGAPGSNQWIELFSYPVKDPVTKKVTGVVEFVRDITKRKNALDELERNEALLNSTQHLTKIGGWEWDIEKQTMFWTDEVYKIHGFDKTDFIPGKKEHIAKSIECYPGEAKDTILEAFQKCAQQGKPYDLELPFVTAKGRNIWVRTSAKPVYKNKKIVRVIGSIMDITEQKLARETLRESEENLRITLESIGDAVIATDMSGNIVRMNKTAERLTGWKFSEACGLPLDKVFNIINAIDNKIVENPIKKVLKTGKTVGLANHTVLISKNEKKYHISDTASPIEDKNKNVMGVILVFSDITDKYIARQKIIESEKRYKSLVTEMSQGLALHEIILDKEGKAVDYRFIDTNPAFEKLTGLKRKNIIGKTVLEVLPNTEEYWIKEYGKVALTGKSIHYENYSRELGHYYEVIAFRPHPMQFATIVTDITERKKAETDLISFKNAIENSSDAIGFATPEGVHYYQNKAFSKLFGDIHYDPLSVYVNPEIGKEMFETIKQGMQWNGELEMYSKKREIVNIYLRAYANKNAKGEITGLVGIHMDITERKKAEKALKNSERQFKSLFMESPVSIIIHNKETGEIIDANPSACLSYGVSSVDKLKETDFWLDPPYSLDDAFALIRKASLEGPQRFEWLSRKISGEFFWEQVTLNTANINGVERVLATSIDITERKKAEKALKFQATILDQIGDLVTATDLQGKIIYVNEAECETFGKTKEELIGKSTRIYGEDSKHGAKQKEILQKTLENGEWRGEVVNFDKDNNAIIMDCRTWTMSDSNGKPYALVGVSTNITERKQNEEELRKSEDRAKKQRAAIVSLATDKAINSGDIAEASKKITEIMVKAMDVERASVWLLSEDNKDLVCISLYEAAKNRHSEGDSFAINSFPSYFEAINKDSRINAEDAQNDPRTQELNRDYHIPCNIRSLLDAGIVVEGNMLGVVSFESVGKKRRWHHDEEAFSGNIAAIMALAISNAERKRLEDTREQLQKQLLHSQKMESIGKLAGGIAHDFNNILTVIKGYADFLSQTQSDTETNEGLKIINEATDKAIALTSQILSFSKSQFLQKQTVNLNEIILNLLKMLKRLIGSPIKIVKDLEKDLWLINADISQIDQIIINIAINARDAMPDGGVLSISTENVELSADDAEQLGLNIAGNYIRLELIDTGTGIPEENIDRIFEPFFTTKPVSKGTGLGLAMVYGIVKQHDGAIFISSEINKGTIISIYIPAVVEKIEELVKSQHQVAAILYGNNKKVLIVEDRQAILDFAEKLLKFNGYRTVTATTAEEALEIFKKSPEDFDLIFSDLILPGKDGIYLANEAREIRNDIPVLLCSGYADGLSKLQIIEEKHYPFIKKPYGINDLLQKLKEVLER
jgi:PAS domain S-box-containing protein